MVGYPEILSTHGVVRDGDLLVWLETDGPFPRADIIFLVDVVDNDHEVAWQLRVDKSKLGDVRATIDSEPAAGAAVERADNDELVISVPLASLRHAFPNPARLRVHVKSDGVDRGATELGSLHRD